MKLVQEEFDYLRALVHECSSIVIEPGKEYLAEARLSPVAHDEGFPCVQTLLVNMRQSPSARLRSRIVEAMTNNETSFYRDTEPFEALRKVVIPELLVCNSSQRQLTIWSAAASTGQEAYSIAMLIEEEFSGLPGWSVRILGTDISRAALNRARSGLYSQMEVGRGLTPSQLQRHFCKEGSEWRLSENIRRKVDFLHLNLFDPWTEIPACDVVLMRNVLIYFEVEKKKILLRKLRHVLKPEAYLLLGSAEATFGLDDTFDRVPAGAISFYRRSKHRP